VLNFFLNETRFSCPFEQINGTPNNFSHISKLVQPLNLIVVYFHAHFTVCLPGGAGFLALLFLSASQI